MHNMKKYNIILTLLMAVGVFSCQEPVEVPPTTETIGISSLTAYFVDEPLSKDPLAKFSVDVTSLDEPIVIPIPWFYPENSNTQITDITRMRVVAAMDYNCFLNPGLALLDLTKDNHFKYTDGRGEEHDIVIRGEITKLSGKDISSFSVTCGGKPLICVVDKVKKEIKISYFDGDDVSACKVGYTLSPHATGSFDGMESVDLTKEKTFVVTAHDGSTEEYKLIVKNETPVKVNYGYAAGSEEELWVLEIEGVGIPCVATNNLSLAAIGNYVVICPGNGDTPIYLNKANGKREGVITLGDAIPGFVKNDDAGNMLICSHSDGLFRIWRTNDVTKAPTLLLSYDNQTGYPLGGRMSVQGDIDGDAIIVTLLEATTVGGLVNSIVYWEVKAGVIQEPKIQQLTGFVGPNWGAGYWNVPGNSFPAIAAIGVSAADGVLLSVYDENVVYYYDGNFSGTTLLTPDTSLSNQPIPSAIDIKTFNGARYGLVFHVGHWPAWLDQTSFIYLYDMSDMKTVSGDLATSTSLVMKVIPQSFYTQGGGNGGNVVDAGDAILVPSADGYYMNLYYIDNNNRVLGAYQVDCIDKSAAEE